MKKNNDMIGFNPQTKLKTRVKKENKKISFLEVLKILRVKSPSHYETFKDVFVEFEKLDMPNEEIVKILFDTKISPEIIENATSRNRA